MAENITANQACKINSFPCIFCCVMSLLLYLSIAAVHGFYPLKDKQPALPVSRAHPAEGRVWKSSFPQQERLYPSLEGFRICLHLFNVEDASVSNVISCACIYWGACDTPAAVASWHFRGRFELWLAREFRSKYLWIDQLAEREPNEETGPSDGAQHTIIAVSISIASLYMA